MLLTRMREGCFLRSKVSRTLVADLYVYLPVGPAILLCELG